MFAEICFITYSVLVLFLLIKNNVIFELFSFLSKKANNSSHSNIRKEIILKEDRSKKERKKQNNLKEINNKVPKISEARKEMWRERARDLWRGVLYAKTTGNQDVINFATIQWNKFKKEHPDIAAEFQKIPLKKEKSEHRFPEVSKLRAEFDKDYGSRLWRGLQRAKKTGNRVIIDYAELDWNKFKKEHPDIAVEVQKIPFPEPKKIQSIFENKTRPLLFG